MHTSLVWAVDSTRHWSYKWFVPQSTSVAARRSRLYSGAVGRDGWRRLFQDHHHINHSLYQILPPSPPFRPNQCSLRKRGHPFQLPIINTGHPFKINFHQQVPLSVCVILSLPPHFRLRGPSRSAARQAWCGRLAASYFKLLHPSCFIFQFGPRSAYFHMLLLLCFLFYV